MQQLGFNNLEDFLRSPMLGEYLSFQTFTVRDASGEIYEAHPYIDKNCKMVYISG